ncbi:hypothetical protein [Sinorhizobium meliloti]|uniref:hypothetical protein n=1 Tax=Rhizobium meliloti TaxID=382 RepID=UPI0001E4AB68|nr:hypothetical protein [Sinorhizobium meliloti]AEG53157.1 hypothetical protein Sinme_1410 [Sinorhizobium meliloti AK83]MDE4591128.1 hypothetical protein [Sinorhizobium meliloti]SEI56234.1 hypothetical protein SAMN04244575_01058 [Sinorhizobium meliloti]
MSNERPDHIVCIRHTHEEKKTETWCGKRAFGFLFQDTDHAAYNGMNKGRLVACDKCTAAIIECLVEGQEAEQ